MKKVIVSTVIIGLSALPWTTALSAQDIESTCSDDGRAQGRCAMVMARSEFGLDSLLQADGAAVCFISGTEAARLLEEYYEKNGMSYSPLVYDNLDGLIFNVNGGACDLFVFDARDVNSVSNKIPTNQFAALAELSGD